MIFAIDFDGTCVTHAFPEIGEDIGAVPILKKITESGHKLILFTMRSGAYLEQAVNWFKDHQIPLYGIQADPEQHAWTQSPKASADHYIDDRALGCPLKWDKDLSPDAFVDWKAIEVILNANGIFNPKP